MDVTDAAEPVTKPSSPIEPAAGRPRGPALRRGMVFASIAWMFGAVWFAAISGTPVTLYAKALGATPFQFGILTALPFLASLLSMPGSFLIEATGKRKRIFLIGHYIQRLMWIPIALIPLWMLQGWGAGRAAVAMNAYLLLVFVMYAAQALTGPGWVAWMADLIPDRIRGKYFARRRQLGLLTAIPAAFIVGIVLDRYAGGGDIYTTAKWCAIVLLVSVPFAFMDIHLFEYVPDVPTRPRKGRHLLHALRRPLHDRQFLWFAAFVGTLTFAMSFMNQFVTLHVLNHSASAKWGLNLTTQMMVIITPYIAQLLVVGVWGLTADRMGKKPLLVAAALALVPVGFGWCFLTEGTIWLGYLLSAAGGAFWAGVEIANFNLALDFSQSGDGEEGGSSYWAVNCMIVNVAGCLGGLCAGGIAQLLVNWSWTVEGFKTFTSYEVLFAVSAVLRLVAVVVFLPHIHEHAARPTLHAIRFMTANVYNNLFGAMQAPLKVLGLKRREAESAKEVV